MSHPAGLVLSCCSVGGLFSLSPPPWDPQCFCALLWWEQHTLWKQTEGMTLTSLGFSFWKAEPIAPIWQVCFKRYMDSCEMIRVKATELGLAPGWCSVTLDLPCLWLCVGKKHGAMAKSTGAGVRCPHLTPGSSVMLSEVCSMLPWFLNQG